MSAAHSQQFGQSFQNFFLFSPSSLGHHGEFVVIVRVAISASGGKKTRRSSSGGD
jgi:hypothetical protein